jgi:EpsD family peptidyl-prolyl cis-trans isomerase
MISTNSRFTLPVLAATLALALSACGSKDDSKVATQVAAKVGSEEISVHQINQVLGRSNTSGASPEAVKTMSRDILEKLIDQQIAVDQATEAKLNRSPDVVSQLEASRREILARAYIQKVVGGISKPTPEDVKKYYADHPQLFAERRIFNVQEIVVPLAPGIVEQLRSFSAAGKPIEESAAWLKSKDIKFGGGSATRAAEQIPLELLAQVHTLKDGQSLVIQSPQSVTLLRVASSQLTPVPEAAALPRIEQFLTNQRAGEAVAANIKLLRGNTKIAYLGEFSKDESTTAAAVAPAPVASASASAEDKAKNSIEKGIAGLK